MDEFEDLYHDEPQEPKKPAPPREKIILTLQEIWAGALSRIVLGLLLFTAFVAGAWVAGAALHDPDTCWLLGLGRWMVEHKAIPDIDPFSWTFATEEAKGRHFILYQWLSELIFYLSTLSGGLLTLLMLTAVTVVTAFISLPIGYVVKREAPFLAGIAVVFIGLMAGSFHFLCRPEIFSYLFTAIFLQVLHYARVAAAMENQRIFRIAFILTPLMILWANMHTGFVTGISIIGACLLGAILGHLFLRENGKPLANKPLIVELALALLGTILATLVTPYGLRLWAYIPDLFGSPINKYIVELRPLSWAAMKEVTYWPYLALCMGVIVLVLRELVAVSKLNGNAKAASLALQGQPSAVEILPSSSSGSHSLDTDLIVLPPVPAISTLFMKSEILTAAVTGTIAIICGFSGRRLIVFTALIIVGEIVAMLGLRRLGSLERAAAEVAAAGRASAKSMSEVIAVAEAIDAGKLPAEATLDIDITKNTPESFTTNANAAISPGPGQPQTSASDSAPGARKDASKRTFWQDVDIHSLDVWLTGGTFELAIVSFCAIAGVCLIATRVSPPELPASSIAFKAPFKAIAYIEEHRAQLPARLFNDPQYGDMIIWQLRGDPKVFVDTRFDMYGARIVGDYRTINECLENWRPLFDSYNIGWVFVNAKSNIAKALKADSAWETRYEDDAAVILVRKAAPPPAVSQE